MSKGRKWYDPENKNGKLLLVTNILTYGWLLMRCRPNGANFYRRLWPSFVRIEAALNIDRSSIIFAATNISDGRLQVKLPITFKLARPF